MPPSMRSALAPVSAVLTRMTSLTGDTQSLPSPCSPVWAAATRTRATAASLTPRLKKAALLTSYVEVSLSAASAHSVRFVFRLDYLCEK